MFRQTWTRRATIAALTIVIAHSRVMADDAKPAEKKPGVVRIGVVLPATQMDDGGNGVAEATRSVISQHLTGPTVEVMPITARIPIHIQAEAQTKQCDYVLYSDVNQKRGRAGFGGLMQGAGVVADVLPYSGAYGSHAGAVAATAARSSIHAAQQASSGVKAKSEVSFGYRLLDAKNAVVLTGTHKQKATADGEDVITPLVGQMATAVVTKASASN